MSAQLIVVGICVLLAFIFMFRKFRRSLAGKQACDCENCGSDNACRQCCERLPKNLRDLNASLKK